MDNTILNDATIPILSLLGGVIATVVVARYYFLRTVAKSKKSLTPYIDFFSELLDGIDQEVRRALSIKYQEIEVENLIEVQFLVANTGEKPIRDVITPLTLSAPNSSKIMNAALLHISPEGRKVSHKVDKDNNTIIFEFDLLNKDEFFVVKLLLSGKAGVEDFIFSITVDDLPPKLETESLPRDLIEVEDADTTPKIEWSLILVGFAFLILGASIYYVVLEVLTNLPPFKEKSIVKYISEIPLLWVAQWPAVISGVAVFCFGILMMVAAVSDSSLFSKISKISKKKKLSLPKGITRSKTI